MFNSEYKEADHNYDYRDELQCALYEDYKRQQKVEEDLKGAQDYFEGVVKEIFSNEELDLPRLYWYLEELGAYLDVKVPKKQLNLKREVIFVEH